MTYDQEVLADSPLAYWKCDELPGSSQVLDYSGNGRHATVVTEWAELGIAGPIETDSPNLAGKGGVARGPADAALDTTGDCTWEVWGNMGDPTGITMPLLSRGSSPGHPIVQLNDEKIMPTLRIGGVVYTLSSADGLPYNDWYHAVMRRVGNVMRLYVNGYLVDERTDLGGGPIEFTGTQWGIGLAGSGVSLGFSQGVARAAIYGTSLSNARILAHYEAARNSLPMYATLTGRASVVLDATPPLVYDAYPLRHNFASPVIERLSRLTGVQLSKDATEERTGRSTKTRRRVAFESLVPNASARRLFSKFLWSNLRQPVALPIIQDTVPLTAAADATDTEIACDTRYRDFDVDSRVRLFSSETNFELAEIEALTTTTITLKDPLENAWPQGTRVAPAKLAYLEQEMSVVGLTSEIEDVRALGSILVEDIPASPNRITSHVPDYTYRSTEVFDPYEWNLNDYSEAPDNPVSQIGEPLDAGTGVFLIDSDIDHAQQGIGYNLLLSGREQISSFLGWFENRAGRLNKLWVPTMQYDFSLVSLLDSTITVTDSHYVDDYAVGAHRRDVALVQRNRTLIFRRINSVAAAGANEVLTLDSSVFAYMSTTRKLCFLRMCRLETDEIELVWLTNDKVRVTLKFREILNEI